MVRSQIAQGVEAAHQLTDHLDPSDPDRQMAEANLAFLQHLVDPEVDFIRCRLIKMKSIVIIKHDQFSKTVHFEK